MRLLKSVFAAALLTASGLAYSGSQNCADKSPPTPQEAAQRTAQAKVLNDWLEKQGDRVVLLVRQGQTLSDYGLSFSHAGYAVRERNGTWRVYHNLNTCGTAQSELWIQGLYQFIDDDLAGNTIATLHFPPALQSQLLKVLRDQQPLIHRYWHDATVQMNDFKNEGVAASSSWPYQANGLKAEGQPVATVFPKEGVTGWADTTMLHSEAKHPVCAYKWMNWSLTPKVQGDVAAWFGSLPVVPESCKASALLGDKGCETNGYDQFARIHFWKTPVAEGGKYVPYSRWTQDYIAIMGGR